MKILKLRTFIPSGENYKLAQQFYEELGFEKIYSGDDVSIFRIGGQEFFLQNYHNEEMQNNFMMDLHVEDLDIWWEQIKKTEIDRKFQIKLKGPELYPWGYREIHLIDPAGVLWHISEIPKASE